MAILKLDAILAETTGDDGKAKYANLRNSIATAMMHFKKGDGIIGPNNIAEDIDRLKFIVKRGGTSQLLGRAISLFENYGGPVKLFDISNIDSTAPMLAPCIPFIPAQGKATTGAGVGQATDGKLMNAVFMNMARLGNWSSEGGTYENVAYNTDLMAVLVNGYIAYQCTFGGKMEDVYGNTAVIQNLTIIYVYLFVKALKSCTQIPLDNDTDRDNLRYAVAEFFQIHSLGKAPGDAVDSVAYRCTTGRSTTQSSVKAFVDNFAFDYSTMGGFLESLGQALYSSHIRESAFMSAWLSNYGEGMLIASEWAPFLTYYIIATYHGARLDNICKLFRYKQDISNLGQPVTKLYEAIATTLG